MKSMQNFINLILILGFFVSNQLLAQPAATNQLVTIRKAVATDQRRSGDNQYNLTGSALSDPVVVRVLSGSEPVAGYPVHFTLIATPKKAKGASVEPTPVLTDKEGFAQSTVRLGSKPGEYLIAARLATDQVDKNQVFFTVHARKPSWVFFLVMGLVGGLGLFLFGMNMMSDGMKKSAGNKMRTILERLTTNRFIAMLVGALVTMTIQSSSATTVMLVSFVHAGLMSFVQALGVILGSNIGTTVTAQIIAFKITDYALLMIAIGIALYLFGRRDSHKYYGEVILGFGLLFLGMSLMSKAMYPLRDYQPFIDVLKSLENPLLGILAGAIFTALVQSSSAFTGIVIVLAIEGVLTLEAGIPLILGANVGTCITAGLASITASQEARRVALAHVLFNLAGVLIFLPFVGPFADFVRSISPGGAAGADLGTVVPRQIANAHTIFNVAAAVIFLPLVGLFAKLIIRLMPEKITDRGLQPTTLYLDERLISTPAMAIDLAIAEIASILRLLDRMVSAIIQPFIEPKVGEDVSHPQLNVIEGIQMREDKIDYLDEQVSKYLLAISRQHLDDEQTKEVYGLLSVVNDMESIGDVVNRSLMPMINLKLAANTDFSAEGRKELVSYHKKVMKQIYRLESFFDRFKLKDVEKIIKKRGKYLDLQYKLLQEHLQRVGTEQVESVSTHQVHVKLMDTLKRINSYIGDIAKTLADVIMPETHSAFWVKQEDGEEAA
ncbi:MAG: Na/Pi cotransporter family protein [Candidatus Marinimicrobia bacterium]|nr:Na/Pi cotransporter family protein [Candidatus Neomarinimicrobiota bacterium]